MASSYQDRLCAHLAAYKVQELGIESPGLFRYRGRQIEKAHILPNDQAWMNILPLVREEVQSYVGRHPDVRLHRYFHHLNSSQALALNLFVPFFEGGPEASRSLLLALGQHGTVPPGNWALEVVPDLLENTNIDVRWTSSPGTQTICEVKLSEAGFGKARPDEKHFEKLRDTYAPGLRVHIPEALLQPHLFFSNYQIFRNIWHMVKDDRRELLFLMPRANEALWPQLNAVVSKLSPELRRRISVQAMEDVFMRVHDDVRCPSRLRNYATLLAVKYVCPGGATS